MPGGHASAARLPATFFARPAPEVAPDLLGKRLVVGPCEGRITEVEAYTSDDPASHTFRGRTARNATMFGPAGRFYVYFTYGMHWCANIVTGDVDDGQAVLLRAVEPLVGLELMRERRHGRPTSQLADGPAKLAQAFSIDRTMDATPAEVFDDGIVVAAPLVGPRIGITRAVERPWRFRMPANR